MKTGNAFLLSLVGIAIAASLAFVPAAVSAQQGAAAAIKIGSTDIAGVVAGPKGPEAGVWVIAETTDLPTKFTRIVVTDERGRYLIPDLPRANYTLARENEDIGPVLELRIVHDDRALDYSACGDFHE